MMNLNGERGFTLIELMIVIVVIGILATVAIPQLTKVREKAKLSTVQSEFASIKTVMEMYYVDKQQYPEKLEDLDPDYTSSAVLQDDTDNYYDNAGQTTNTKEGDLTNPEGDDWQSYTLEYNLGGSIVTLNSENGRVIIN